MVGKIEAGEVIGGGLSMHGDVVGGRLAAHALRLGRGWLEGFGGF